MQPHHFTYHELTPLEQCIAEFMAQQREQRVPETKKKRTPRKLADA
jgi:hypothetical protein